MAKLQIILPSGDQVSHELTDEKVTIGRLPDNSLHIEDISVSSRHAEITFEGGVHHLHDLGSTNGTFFNGERTTDAILVHGAEIRFGIVESVFHAEDGSDQPLPETQTASAELPSTSSRPAAFVSSSPLARASTGKDPVAIGLFAAAALGLVAFLVASIVVFQMAPPV